MGGTVVVEYRHPLPSEGREGGSDRFAHHGLVPKSFPQTVRLPGNCVSAVAAAAVRYAFIGGIGYFAANNGRQSSAMILRDTTQVSMQSFFQSIGTLRKPICAPSCTT